MGNLGCERTIIIPDTNKMIDKYNHLTDSDSFILNRGIKKEIKLYNENLLNASLDSIKKEITDQVISTNSMGHLHKVKITNSSCANIRFDDNKIYHVNLILKVLNQINNIQSSYGNVFNYYIDKLNYLKNSDFVYTMSEVKFNVIGLINASCNYYIIGKCEIDKMSKTEFRENNFLLGLLLDLHGSCLQILNNLFPYYNVRKLRKKIGDFEVKEFNKPYSTDMEIYNFLYSIIIYVHNILKSHYNIETNFKEIKLTLK